MVCIFPHSYNETKGVVMFMPLMACRENGKPGYKWGESGKCYTYTPNDPVSRTQARNKALAQMRAIKSKQTQNKD